jgi:hypothetical protein
VPAEIGDQWEIHGGLPNPHGRGWQLPSGNDCYSSRTGSHGPVEIVDFPSYKMVMFHSYVHVYQRVNPIKSHQIHPP